MIVMLQDCVIVDLQGCVIVVLQGCVIVTLQGCVINSLEGCVILGLQSELFGRPSQSPRTRTLKPLRTRTRSVCLFTHLYCKEVNISQKKNHFFF
jgi:hypothetical protein